MPRDLTDLMEQATSSAPPEPYAAADITSLAARRHRRRTTGIAAGLAVAVVVAGGVGYGVTRGNDSTPEPADHYRYDQKVDLSDAVPASSLPGYRLEPWTIPSVQRFSSGNSPLATYESVDADGRLIVEDFPGTVPQASQPRIRLFDGPGQSASTLRVPALVPSHGDPPTGWVPTFFEGGRLLWVPYGFITDTPKQGFHLTDLSGGSDRFVHSGFILGKAALDGTPGHDRPGGVSGDRMWFLSFARNLPQGEGTAFDLYTATFGGRPVKVASNVADLAVGGGRVAWVTTSGKLLTESAAGGSPRTVDVPLDRGCRLPIQVMQTYSREFAVSRPAISITEACGAQKTARYAVLAFDPSGRRLVHVAVPLPSSVSIVGSSLLFVAGPDSQLFRYDFVTGSVATVGRAAEEDPRAGPQGAGDYVLWYDDDGGHVARIPQ